MSGASHAPDPPEPIFELSDVKPLFRVSEGMAVDLNGKFYARLGDGAVLDMDTGETRFTSPWPAPQDGADPDF